MLSLSPSGRVSKERGTCAQPYVAKVGKLCWCYGRICSCNAHTLGSLNVSMQFSDPGQSSFPKQGLLGWGSHGIVLVLWISPTLWSGSAAEPPRSHRTATAEEWSSRSKSAQAWPRPRSGNLEIWGPGNPEIWDPKHEKSKNSQNPNRFCPKCRQGLD